MEAIDSTATGRSGPLAAPAAEPRRTAEAGPFGDRISAALRETDRLLVAADRTAAGYAEGSAGAVEALVALSKAELALRHVVAMGTRALDAYREVMRMQL